MLLRQKHLQRSLLCIAQFLRIGVAARCQRLELPEDAGGSLEEPQTRACHLEREQRARPPEVHQIQALGLEHRCQRQVQGVKVGRRVGQHRHVDVAVSTGPPARGRPEEDEELQLRHSGGDMTEPFLNLVRQEHKDARLTRAEDRRRGRVRARHTCAALPKDRSGVALDIALGGLSLEEMATASVAGMVQFMGAGKNQVPLPTGRGRSAWPSLPAPASDRMRSPPSYVCPERVFACSMAIWFTCDSALAPDAPSMALTAMS